MSIQWIVQMASLTLIHWIEIYPMDSAIQLSEQPGPALLVLPNPQALFFLAAKAFRVTWSEREAVRPR